MAVAELIVAHLLFFYFFAVATTLANKKTQTNLLAHDMGLNEASLASINHEMMA